MERNRIQKAIRSDVGMVATIAMFLATVLVPFYSIKTEIAVLESKFDSFSQSVTNLQSKDDSQDAMIDQNAEAISNVQGQLTQRGFNMRQADTTNETSKQ